MIEFIRGLFPTTAQLPWAGGGAVLTLIFNSLFPIHEWLVVLLYAMVVDFILGVMAAYLNDNLALDSRRGNRRRFAYWSSYRSVLFWLRNLALVPSIMCL